METKSTINNAIGTALTPIATSTRKAMSAVNAPTMKMSPWAKLIMPMMP